ncbi:hypothetical protein J132_09042 [Termitomyces sp. J132]|nr:hypothetical protein J132_09042 [Termitomyces sp. J132]
MQSTNRTLDQLLGLAHNISCTIDNIILYLQIHVLWSSTYNILLGHSFDVLTRSMVNTLSNVEIIIIIMDPNTSMWQMKPTFPCAYLYATACDLSEFSLPFELLNCVTIHHSGVPPFLDHVAESFIGCICSAMLDLYFINNVGAKGAKDWKIINSVPAKHPTNPNIYLALWEFFKLLNQILQQMKYCSGTFSGHKLVFCTPTFKILVVDTSYIAIGYYLCQCASDNCKECCYNHFGSITLNNRESQFSQPKLEFYGLYCALQALQMYLIGIRNLIIEVDACYIKGMLQNPDIQPSTSMNHWIMVILMFHFELVYIKGTFHGPDGLLWHLLQPSNPTPNDSNNLVYEDWITCLHGFIHQVQLPLPLLCQVSSALPLLSPLLEFQLLQPLATFVSDDSNSPVPQLANRNNILPLHDDGTTTYSDVPHSTKAIASETCMLMVEKWLNNHVRPESLSNAAYATFICYASMFFIAGRKLWHCIIQ